MRKQKVFIVLAIKEDLIDENDVKVLDIEGDFMLASVKCEFYERNYEGEATKFFVKEFVP